MFFFSQRGFVSVLKEYTDCLRCLVLMSQSRLQYCTSLYPLFKQLSDINHIMVSMVADKVYMRNVTVFLYYHITSTV